MQYCVCNADNMFVHTSTYIIFSATQILQVLCCFKFPGVTLGRSSVNGTQNKSGQQLVDGHQANAMQASIVHTVKTVCTVHCPWVREVLQPLFWYVPSHDASFHVCARQDGSCRPVGCQCGGILELSMGGSSGTREGTGDDGRWRTMKHDEWRLGSLNDKGITIFLIPS